ncbi:MAG: NAD(P)/FAD-dependent oxidoreductase [Halobacteriales archaeon]
MEKVDVAVVGGGPAGANAAMEAATSKDVVVYEAGVDREDREERGPDSTDAAGLLDYWLDIMDVGPEEYDEVPVLQEIDYADFRSPEASFELRDTGIDSWYDGFGVTFDRVAYDDQHRERAVERGVDYRIEKVQDVEVDPASHVVKSAESEVEADYLVLADGPGRRVSLDVLDELCVDDSVRRHLGPSNANHVAHQEHRRFPDEVFEDDVLRFWWGYVPGETAYPWYFPNDDGVVRLGVTLPMGLRAADVDEPGSYALVDGSDEGLPSASTYIERLLEHEYPGYDVEDFPLVEDRGKQGGRESYPISSTSPVDSPVGAGVVAVGGAMGATSAFHEGGYHLAVATGKLAGELVADDSLDIYNERWRHELGDEMARNVGLAHLVEDYGPTDWDGLLRVARASVDGGWLSRLRVAHKIYLLRRRYLRGRSSFVGVEESDYRL